MPYNETPESRAKRISNLIPIKKGEVLNKTGRRGRHKSLITWISKLPTPKLSTDQLFKQLGITKRKITYEEGILLRLASEAFKGDLRAIELWLDRKYGRVPQSMDISTTNNGPLVAIIQNVDVIKTAENITEGKVVDVLPESPSIPPPTP